MGGSAPNDARRRYARPGEFEIPSSVLESNSFKQRLGGELNSDRKNPASLLNELRPCDELRPIRTFPSPTKVEARLSGDLNQRSSAVSIPREMHLCGELNLPRSPAPGANEARLRADLNRYPRNPSPLSNRGPVVKGVSARFELLPEPKSRWNGMGVSAVGQLAFLGLILLSPVIFPHQMGTALKFDVVELMQPVTHINIPPTTPPPPPPKIKPKVQQRESKPIVPKPKPLELEPPELSPRQPHVFLVLKPELPKVRAVEAKPVELKPIFAQAEIVLTTSQPKRPKEEIQVPNLGLGPLPASVVAAANKVQTGGFGDPHGIPGPANPSKAANINQAGSRNLPGGPGHGNGTGGAQGARGTLASTEGPKSSGAATGSVTKGVDILSEPNPAYSTEARTLRLEGDVVLEVVFLASGQMQVIRVVSGLGHGLDEAAIQAAQLIRFRPAQRNGQPVDFHARVRIEFRLVN